MTDLLSFATKFRLRVILLAVLAQALIGNLFALPDVTQPVRTYGLGALGGGPFSPAGDLVVTTSPFGVVLWTVATGDILRVIPKAPGQITGFPVFSPDGARLLFLGPDGDPSLYDVATGNLIQTFQGGVTNATFTPDGARVILPSGTGDTRLWNIASGELIRTFEGEFDPLGLSSDGTRIITATAAIVRVRDLETGGVLLELPGSTNGRFLTGEGEIATMSGIWDAQTADFVRGFPIAGTLSPNGKYIARSASGTAIELYDAMTGGFITQLVFLYQTREFKFTADSRWLLAAGDDAGVATVRVYDIENNIQRVFPASSFATLNIVPSPDSRRILTIGNYQNAKIFDLEAGLMQTLDEHTFSVSALSVSADGSRILSGTYNGSAYLWDTASGQLQLRIEDRILDLPHLVYSVALSPNGQNLVVGGTDGFEGDFTQSWDPDGILQWSRVDTNGRSHVFSSDGTRLAFSNGRYEAQIVDAAGEQLLAVFSGHEQEIDSVDLSRDGTRLATGSLDATARIWDVATTATLFTLSGHSGAINSVQFSSDGQRVITGSGDQTAMLWDANDGAPIRTFSGHTGSVNSAKNSPLGTRILTGSSDGLVILWDAVTGEPIERFVLGGGSVSSVAFMPGGEQILSGHGDGRIALWDLGLPAETPLATPTPSATPTLTPTVSPTENPSMTPTEMPTAPASPTETPTPPVSPTESPIPSASPTATPSMTPSESPTPSSSPTESPIPSASPTETSTPTPLPQNNAELVGSSIPQELPVGQTFLAQVTFRNNGDKTWTAAGGYALGVAVDLCGLIDGNSIPLSPVVSIGPKESYTFKILLTAPVASESCASPLLRLRMIQEKVGFFGESLTVSPQIVEAINDAIVIGNSIPPTVPPGVRFGISVTLRNTGNTTWSSGQYTLSATDDPCSIFGEQTTIEIPDGLVVGPDTELQFNGYVTMPSTPGNCTATLRMQAEGGQLFGAEVILSFDVQSPTNSVQGWEQYE